MEAHFETYRGKRGGYFWRLKANGVVIASSGRYYSKNGAKKTIDLINANGAHFAVDQDNRGYFWRLEADGGVYASNDRYNPENGAKRIIDLIKANAPITTVVALDKPPTDLTLEERQRQNTLLKQLWLNWKASTRKVILRRPASD